MRKCFGCNIEKEESDFNDWSKHKMTKRMMDRYFPGRENYCKKCNAEFTRVQMEGLKSLRRKK